MIREVAGGRIDGTGGGEEVTGRETGAGVWNPTGCVARPPGSVSGRLGPVAVVDAEGSDEPGTCSAVPGVTDGGR